MYAARSAPYTCGGARACSTRREEHNTYMCYVLCFGVYFPVLGPGYPLYCCCTAAMMTTEHDAACQSSYCTSVLLILLLMVYYG